MECTVLHSESEMSSAQNIHSALKAPLASRMMALAGGADSNSRSIAPKGACAEHNDVLEQSEDTDDENNGEVEEEEEVVYMTEEDLLCELDKQEPALQVYTYK